MPIKFDPAGVGQFRGSGVSNQPFLSPAAVSLSASVAPGVVLLPLAGKVPGSSYSYTPNSSVILNNDNNLAASSSAMVAGTSSVTVTETTALGVKNSVTIPVNVSAALSPPTTGLVGWYKASVGVTTGSTITTPPAGTSSTGGAAVTGWADQSGNGNNLTGVDSTASPILVSTNGSPRVRFNTTAGTIQGKALSLPSGMSFDNRNLSIYAIVRSAPAFEGGASSGWAGSATLAALLTAGTSQGVAAVVFGSEKLANRDSVFISSTLYESHGEELIGIQWGPTGNTTKARLILGADPAQVTNLGTATTTTGGFVGSFTGTANGFIGDVIELLIYNSPNVDENAIRAYAQARAKAGPPTTGRIVALAGDGDSQMAGQNATLNYNDQSDGMLTKLSRLFTTIPKLRNYGIGSQTIKNQITNAKTANTGTDTFLAKFPLSAAGSPGYAARVLILDFGTNSLATTIGNQDGPTTVADLAQYLDDRIAAGWNPTQIYVVPIRPRSANGNGPAYDAGRAYYNANAPAICGARGAKWLGQFLLHPAWSGTMSNDPTYYQSDNLHQNNRNQGDEAAIIYAQLKADGLPV